MKRYDIRLLEHGCVDIIVTDDVGPESDFTYFKEPTDEPGINLTSHGAYVCSYNHYKADKSNVVTAYDPKGQNAPLLLGRCEIFEL